jgi:hypothetical protein
MYIARHGTNIHTIANTKERVFYRVGKVCFNTANLLFEVRIVFSSGLLLQHEIPNLTFDHGLTVQILENGLFVNISM